MHEPLEFSDEFSDDFRAWMRDLGDEHRAELTRFDLPAEHRARSGAQAPKADERELALNVLCVFRHYSQPGAAEGSWHLDEIFFIAPLPDGWVRLTDAGRRVFLFDFASMEGAEVYLAVRHADLARQRLRTRHIRRRNEVGATRFTMRVAPWQGPAPHDESNMHVFSAQGRDWFRTACPDDRAAVPVNPHAVDLTWYADAPLAEVLASLRTPSAGPLFELRGAAGD